MAGFQGRCVELSDSWAVIAVLREAVSGGGLRSYVRVVIVFVISSCLLPPLGGGAQKVAVIIRR